MIELEKDLGNRVIEASYPIITSDMNEEPRRVYMIVNSMQISEDDRGFISNLNMMSGSDQTAFLKSVKHAAGETFVRDLDEDDKEALNDVNYGWEDLNKAEM